MRPFATLALGTHRVPHAPPLTFVRVKPHVWTPSLVCALLQWPVLPLALHLPFRARVLNQHKFARARPSACRLAPAPGPHMFYLRRTLWAHMRFPAQTARPLWAAPAPRHTNHNFDQAPTLLSPCWKELSVRPSVPSAPFSMGAFVHILQFPAHVSMRLSPTTLLRGHARRSPAPLPNPKQAAPCVPASHPTSFSLARLEPSSMLAQCAYDTKVGRPR